MRQGTVIAYKQAATSTRVVGYRVKGTRKFGGKVLNIPTDTMKGILRDMPDAVDNLELVGDEIKFVNGAMNRYVDLNNFSSGQGALVVLNKFDLRPYDGKVVYEVSDYEGNTIICDEDLAVLYMRKYTIANGKLVDHNGRTIISAIKGEYPTEDLTPEEIEYLITNTESPDFNQKRKYCSDLLTPDEQAENNRLAEQARNREEARRRAEEEALQRRRNESLTSQLRAIGLNKTLEVKGFKVDMEALPAEDLLEYTRQAGEYLKHKGIPFTTERLNIETVKGEGHVPVDIIRFTSKQKTKGEETQVKVGVYGYRGTMTSPFNKTECILYTLLIKEPTANTDFRITHTKFDSGSAGSKYIKGDKDALREFLGDYGIQAVATQLDEDTAKALDDLRKGSLGSTLKGTTSLLSAAFKIRRESKDFRK